MTKQASSDDRLSLRQKLSAWLVHGFTASGAVLAILAVAAIDGARWREALLWLFAALVIDGIDGSLARAAQVHSRAPRLDGEVLDLVIDYLTYVFVPTLFIWRSGLIPLPLVLPLAALIQLASLYVFARRDMKTPDGYFRGFPALWNIVALYFFVAQPGPAVATAVIVTLAGLSFAPIHVVHPFRVHDYGRWLPAVAAIWAGSTLLLLLPLRSLFSTAVPLAVSLASASVLLLLGLLRSIRGPAAHA